MQTNTATPLLQTLTTTPSKVLTKEEHALIAKAATYLLAHPPRESDQKQATTFSPFIYPH